MDFSTWSTGSFDRNFLSIFQLYSFVNCSAANLQSSLRLQNLWSVDQRFCWVMLLIQCETFLLYSCQLRPVLFWHRGSGLKCTFWGLNKSVFTLRIVLCGSIRGDPLRNLRRESSFFLLDRVIDLPLIISCHQSPYQSCGDLEIFYLHASAEDLDSADASIPGSVLILTSSRYDSR